MLSDSAPSQKLDAKAIDSQVPTYGGEAHAKRTQAANGHSLHGRCVAELRCHGVSNTCPLCRKPLSELRTVSGLLDEAFTLKVRMARFYGLTENGSYGGRCDPEVNVKALAKDMLKLTQEAFTLDPANWDAQCFLGVALNSCGLRTDAKTHYLQVLKMNPPAHPEIAKIHLELGRTPRAGCFFLCGARCHSSLALVVSAGNLPITIRGSAGTEAAADLSTGSAVLPDGTQGIGLLGRCRLTRNISSAVWCGGCV